MEYYVAIKSKGYSDIENVCGTVNEKQGLQLKSIVILDIFSVMFDLLCLICIYYTFLVFSYKSMIF